MSQEHEYGEATPRVNPKPLLENEFLSFDDLMTRLPSTTSREAIRVLCRDRGLRKHRIGKTVFFHVRELIAASAIGGDDETEK